MPACTNPDSISILVLVFQITPINVSVAWSSKDEIWGLNSMSIYNLSKYYKLMIVTLHVQYLKSITYVLNFGPYHSGLPLF